MERTTAREERKGQKRAFSKRGRRYLTMKSVMEEKNIA
jgi:hypothetical protein